MEGKYKDLSWKYPLHFMRFNGMIGRAKQLNIECEFSRTYDDFKKFIEYVGPFPINMIKPTVGRFDHSKGYVIGNFGWQSFSDNQLESSDRNREAHSNAIKKIWATEEGRKTYTEALSTGAVAKKKSRKMKEYWADKDKRESWEKALSEGQKEAWARGVYSGKSGFVVKTKCPWCKKEGNSAPMKRWHFENCPKHPTTLVLAVVKQQLELRSSLLAFRSVSPVTLGGETNNLFTPFVEIKHVI